jgi:hypothetical protein
MVFVKHINSFDKGHSKFQTSGYVLNKLSQLQTFLRPRSSSKVINVPTKKSIEWATNHEHTHRTVQQSTEDNLVQTPINFAPHKTSYRMLHVTDSDSKYSNSHELWLLATLCPENRTFPLTNHKEWDFNEAKYWVFCLIWNFSIILGYISLNCKVKLYDIWFYCPSKHNKPYVW